jgi:hypothetical protein
MLRLPFLLLAEATYDRNEASGFGTKVGLYPSAWRRDESRPKAPYILDLNTRPIDHTSFIFPEATSLVLLEPEAQFKIYKELGFSTILITYR